MLKQLKNEVFEANLSLVDQGLVLFTWGNVSAIHREKGLVAIKPSGISYEMMKPEDIVIVDLNGNVVEGHWKPSSDTSTHLELYQKFPTIGAVAHTHSKWATIWAQARRPIPVLGTTHADNFHGDIPVTRRISKTEVLGQYEQNTGLLIVETFTEQGIDPMSIPAVLVANHGPFSWGINAREAVVNAAVMEYCAEMAYYALELNNRTALDPFLLDKHYQRKHGKDAYYGQ
ncbi:MAG: L-ribulose-5-phosphate 4-epimerase [Anaerolineae bacterium]|jgi:L-ribulose-5-phosphate 4-epimerase|nr:L-ribulose-5-phosphate 4-epimerase [Anaerolineae bacterium]